MRTRHSRWWYGLAIVLLLVAYGIWALLRPLPQLAGTVFASARPTLPSPPALKWPAQGQAAVGILGSPILETHAVQTPLPTASTAKLITVLTVLQQKPLSIGQQGPLIMLTAADVNLFNSYAAAGGSVVRVQAGEQISEYQMLQGLLLPSANNLADSLAIWAFGSLPAYQTAAKAYLAQHGLSHTQIGSDASGFSPNTTSTAEDLVRLGELTMQDPVLASIVGQASAAGLPVVNTVKNVNWLLGTAGIVGIKTGNTDQAGGVYISASRITVNSQPLTIVTALTGVPSLAAALDESLPLIQSSQANFQPVTVVKSGEVVGHYRLPWGGSIAATVNDTSQLKVWDNKAVTTMTTLHPIKVSASTGDIVGDLHITIATGQSYKLPVKLQSRPNPPSLEWRLHHPF